MITYFHGKYFFLSNFYPFEIEFEGVTYKSVEHAFQASKCVYDFDRFQIREAETPAHAQWIGQQVTLRPSWNVYKLECMYKLLRIKFADKELRSMLKNTGQQMILKQNNSHDTFWGLCTCFQHAHFGENHLGGLLMKIRSEIQDKDITNNKMETKSENGDERKCNSF